MRPETFPSLCRRRVRCLYIKMRTLFRGITSLIIVLVIPDQDPGGLSPILFGANLVFKLADLSAGEAQLTCGLDATQV